MLFLIKERQGLILRKYRTKNQLLTSKIPVQFINIHLL